MPAVSEIAAGLAGELAKRFSTCPSGYYYRNGYCYRRSSWSSWGRWVLAGIAIFFFFLMLLSCLCISRRRRTRGVKPMYGTGWMAPQNNNQHGYNNTGNYNQQQSGYNYGNQNAPPVYGQQQQQPQYTGTTFNPNDGYYGQQNSGVQPPQGTYQRNDVYSPPVGPPPGK